MKLLLGVALLLIVGCGYLPSPVPPAPAAGTVTGTVTISPCRPVDRLGDPPCPPRPGIKVHFEQGSAAAATAVTDGTGTYSASLAPGTYQVWAEGGMSKGPFVPVSVVAGQVVTLNLVVDSGIR